jgi:hypothetical protein
VEMSGSVPFIFAATRCLGPPGVGCDGIGWGCPLIPLVSLLMGVGRSRWHCGGDTQWHTIHFCCNSSPWTSWSGLWWNWLGLPANSLGIVIDGAGGIVVEMSSGVPFVFAATCPLGPPRVGACQFRCGHHQWRVGGKKMHHSPGLQG